jgi:hypothetical protein
MIAQFYDQTSSKDLLSRITGFAKQQGKMKG